MRSLRDEMRGQAARGDWPASSPSSISKSAELEAQINAHCRRDAGASARQSSEMEAEHGERTQRGYAIEIEIRENA